MNKCNVDGCNKNIQTRGVCNSHYRMFRRNGMFDNVNNMDGLCHIREYQLWLNMKDRCHNPNNSYYYRYGGRGIKVCDEWRNSFKKFYEYIGSRPSELYSLDRINNDGDYEPNNVRWATSRQQAGNTSVKNKNGYSGIRYRKRVRGDTWCATITVNSKLIYLGTFYKLEDAIQARKKAETFYDISNCEVIER